MALGTQLNLERAAELVKVLVDSRQHEPSYDLFAHFVYFFNLDDCKRQILFAKMCGFGVAYNAEIVDE